MRVVFTSGKKQEQFNAMIAVLEAVTEIADKENFVGTRFFYFASDEVNKKVIYDHPIKFVKITNFIEALLQLFAVFPDVVFSTGGRETKPILKAAFLLGIPVIIHESNSICDPVHEWAQDKASAITVSFKEIIQYISQENRGKIVHTGQPIRKIFRLPSKEGAYELLDLEKDIPIIWVRAGKSGGSFMNQIIEEALPEILRDYQVVHQTGKDNFEEMKMLSSASLYDHPFKSRYHIFDELNELSTRMMAGITELIIGRADGNSIYEAAVWEIPSILIPKTDSYKNYEIRNAYNYARSGSCVVIEENNLNDSGLLFEINRILESTFIQTQMKEGARDFRVDGSEEKIAKEIAKFYLKHELEK